MCTHIFTQYYVSTKKGLNTAQQCSSFVLYAYKCTLYNNSNQISYFIRLPITYRHMKIKGTQRKSLLGITYACMCALEIFHFLGIYLIPIYIFFVKYVFKVIIKISCV